MAGENSTFNFVGKNKGYENLELIIYSKKNQQKNFSGIDNVMSEWLIEN